MFSSPHTNIWRRATPKKYPHTPAARDSSASGSPLKLRSACSTLPPSRRCGGHLQRSLVERTGSATAASSSPSVPTSTRTYPTRLKALNQLRHHPLYGKTIFHSAASRLDQALSQAGGLDQSFYGFGQGCGISRRHQQRVFHAFEKFRDPSSRRGDHRDSTTHGLDDRNRNTLILARVGYDARQNEHVPASRLHTRQQLLVRH